MRLLSRSFSKDTGAVTDEDEDGDGGGGGFGGGGGGGGGGAEAMRSSSTTSLSSSDMSLMRRSAPLRRASSSVSTARVGERPFARGSRHLGGSSRRSGPRSGARSVSNTPRGSPTPEDAECAAIIQAVMHQVSETTRLNPSPPPDDLDSLSGSMLPTVPRPKIPDLKCIEMQTLCSLMDGSWKDKFSKFIVVDCRFGYEYSGGHVRSAVHCPEPKDVITQFFKDPPPMSSLPVCVVFHCEFSKNRAPKM
jgi:hypothetical protein